MDSPPFPSADWSYGGAPTIGEEDGNVYPLQTAIDGAKGRTAHDFLSFRSNFLNDKTCQRTGYAGRYSEGTVSWNHWAGTTVQPRSKVRFDYAWDSTAYDKGTRRNQFTLALDVVYHF